MTLLEWNGGLEFRPQGQLQEPGLLPGAVVGGCWPSSSLKMHLSCHLLAAPTTTGVPTPGKGCPDAAPGPARRHRGRNQLGDTERSPRPQALGNTAAYTQVSIDRKLQGMEERRWS